MATYSVLQGFPEGSMNSSMQGMSCGVGVGVRCRTDFLGFFSTTKSFLRILSESKSERTPQCTAEVDSREKIYFTVPY